MNPDRRTKDANQANIDNLTGLWRRMGARQLPIGAGAHLFASSSWPHRRWLDWGLRPNPSQKGVIQELLDRDSAAIVPVWSEEDEELKSALLASGYQVSFRQIAMRRARDTAVSGDMEGLALAPVSTLAEADAWTKIASQSFGYTIDPNSTRRLVGSPGVDMFVATRSGQSLGTAMLFEDTDAVGVHMIGVPPAFRRQGLARKIMHGVLDRARQARAPEVVLQASDMGESLYLSLGFEPQFVLTNYNRPEVG